MTEETGDETGRAEGPAKRARRRAQRGLFDAAADLYAATRPGYPPALAAFIAATAGAGPGAPVLEVGCGTGQLAAALAPFGFALTAIDIGPHMIEAARRHVAAGGIRFQVAVFEDFAAEPGSFGLVVSGAAFHWIDPEVRFARAARLLRPGGWLALAGYEERYDPPLGPALDALWHEHAAGAGAWVTRPADAAAISVSGLFGPPVHRVFRTRLTRSADDVVGVENTRATTLSWPEAERREFSARLRALTGDEPGAGLTLEASVTMARAGR